MRDAGSVQIAFVVHENLRLVDETPERVRMDDAISVPLELAAKSRWRLREPAAATAFIDRGVRRERPVHRLPAARAQRLPQRRVVVFAGDNRLANTLEEHEADPARGHLLVDLHVFGN